MFNSARLKLTGWYLLIIMIISLSFSAVIYAVSAREIDRLNRIQHLRLERRLEGVPAGSSIFTLIEPSLIEETKNRLLGQLILINGVILITAGVTGYFLAGQTLQPIQEMVDEQTRFVSDASHELRTPLTALKTTLEVTLRDKKLNLKMAKNVLRESLEETNKLQVLSDSLLTLSRVQSANDQLKMEEVSLKEISREAVARISPLALKKKINLDNRVEDFKMRGDREKLIELLVILLDNAVKYSPTKTKVEITSGLKNQQVWLAVKDQGVGIAPEDLPRIFNRFYRADTARSHSSVGGFGLGLSIAQKIVELHHGVITAESQLHQGSVFTVSFPLT